MAVPTSNPAAPSIMRSTGTSATTRRRRKSSSLGADPRGDTGAISLATSGLKQGSPPASSGRERGRKRRKARRFLSRSKRLALKHTWLIPLILITVILALYFVSPGEHNPLHAAIFLSYANPPLHERTHTLPPHIGDVTQYGKGPKDFAFVGFYMIVLSFTREFLMQRLIRPIAIRCGIRGRGKQSRFMEQFYTAVYFAVFGPFGLYVMSRTPVWYFNTAGMYEGFPHRAHESYLKAYYLLEASYWAQQAVVLLLGLEARRKDFRELVLHHIITLALIGLSYRFHFTYIGVAVYITHDISDFFLATSKLLNYVGSSLTPPYFVTFMLIWGYLRHYINLRIINSMLPIPSSLSFLTPILTTIFGTPNEFATIGPFDLNWETHQYKCWISQSIATLLLVALQAVNVFWFFLICRILAKFVFGEVAKDVRSDDEEEEEEEVGADASKHVAGMNGSAVKVQVMVNGKPLSPSPTLSEGEVVGNETEMSARKATLRKR